MAVRVTSRQVLAWRLRRHLLDPVGSASVPDVVRRLCGVQAQVASSAELAIRVRRETSRAGDVEQALRGGRLIKTWAMRGTLHLLTPEDAGDFLSLVASGRSWERPSWQRHFGVSPRQIEALRRAARAALENGPLTREELIAALCATRGLGHLGDALRSGWSTLLKPLAWQGDLCYGPSKGTRVTFTVPEVASTRWKGIPEPDEAAPRAIAAYLGAYGPTTAESFGAWLAGGWFGKRRLREWFSEIEDGLEEVDVDGQRTVVLAEDLDDLASAAPTDAVRLLPGFDQWVLGPGTKDALVVPRGRRSAVSRQSGWISPVVVAGGVVSGTWELDGDRLRVQWFGELGKPPRSALASEAARLSALLGRELRPMFAAAVPAG